MSGRGRTLSPGVGRGDTLTLREPLSFWGGFDVTTGAVIDTHHAQRCALLTDRVLFMARGRGSSSSASVLAEAIRLGTAPAAIVLAEPDLVIALGAAMAAELYGLHMPVVVAPDLVHMVEDGTLMEVEATHDEALLRAGHG